MRCVSPWREPEPILNSSRRHLLRGATSVGTLAVAAAAGLLRPRMAAAEFPRFPETGSPLTEALHALRASNPDFSDAIRIRAPDIAEDGASVFVDFACLLPGVDMFAIFADRNPQPLLAAFHLAPEVLPYLQTRIKVQETSRVWIIARSGGRFFKAAKLVKVTRGGCGLGVN